MTAARNTTVSPRKLAILCAFATVAACSVDDDDDYAFESSGGGSIASGASGGDDSSSGGRTASNSGGVAPDGKPTIIPEPLHPEGGDAGSPSSGGVPATAGGAGATESTGGTEFPNGGASDGGVASVSGSGGEQAEPSPPPPCEHGTIELSDANLVCTCSAGYTGTACELPRFEGVGLPSGSNPKSVATGVSSDGTTVVGLANATGMSTDDRPFRWTSHDGFQVLGNARGQAEATSGDGTTLVGRIYQDDLPKSFRWTESGGFLTLGVPAGGSFDDISDAVGINSAGNVIVGSNYHSSGRQGAFRWSAETGMVPLELPPDVSDSTDASATHVSEDGTVVVGSILDATYSAFRWTAESGMILINAQEGYDAEASDMNVDGSVIVGSAYDVGTGRSHAFRWTPTTGLVTLDVPTSCKESDASATDGSGDLVVIKCFNSIEGDGLYLWSTSGTIRSLADLLTELGAGLSGWTLRSVMDMSPNGKAIVGGGTNPEARFEGWIARLD